MAITYKSAGVDIDRAEEALDRIKKHVRTTLRPEVLTELGHFGGCFQFPAKDYNDPVLVSSADGVGTKLKLAFLTDRHDTVGQCLVNHCVNDILAVGARPLFFLDYFSTGKLDPVSFEQLVFGLAKACRENGTALIGGETAEMPDFYAAGEYDLSGTIVGVVEKEQMLPSRTTKPNDLLVGLPSTGLHTNGYSLARKVLLADHSVDDVIPELGCTVGEELLKIHRSYLPVVTDILHHEWLHGLSHITGGGIEGNTRRVIAEGQSLAVDWEAWEWLPVFKVIQQLGDVPTADMRRSMNLGIGLILVIDAAGLPALKDHLDSLGESYFLIGKLES